MLPEQRDISTASPPFDLFRSLQVLSLQLEQPEARHRFDRLLDLLRLVLRSGGFGVWTFEVGTGLLCWDRSILELYGANPDEFDGQFSFWEERVHPEDLDKAKSALTRFLDGDDHEPVVFRVRRPSGEVRWVEGWAVAERTEEGEFLSMLGVNRDCTKERETEASLAQAQKLEALGRLVSGVAHDFNNILNVLQSTMDMLEEAPGAPDAHELVVEGRAAIARGAALTNRLLAFGRRSSLSPVRLDLNQVVVNITSMLRRVIPERVTVEHDLDSELPPTRADPSLLDNALLNLALNARDAMASGGTLTLRTGRLVVSAEEGAPVGTIDPLRPGEYLVLAVQDTGLGMTPEVARRAFDPFFTTKPMAQGSGLGLSMVAGLVRQSGGSIRIETELGAGTTVHLFFPGADVGERDDGDDETDPPSGPWTPTDILLVEDEAAVRRAVQMTLERAGHRVSVAATGDEGLAMIAAGETPAVLITDVVLPGLLHGWRLAAAARKLRPELRVIYVTGHADDEVLRDVEAHTTSQLLRKPLPRTELLRAVQLALRSRPEPSNGGKDC